VKVTLERGRLGQFDVVVDGEVVARRARGVRRRALGGGWPEPEDVVAKIEAKLARGRPV
jgi:hypothetical protein